MLYVKLKKYIYRCLKIVLLFYQNISSDMRKKGFVINLYDLCVANKMVNSKQMTVTWYVADLKISHVDSSEVTRMIKWLESHYGKMRIFRGKLYDYLGLDLDQSLQVEVSMIMEKYKTGPIEEFSEDITLSVVTTEADNIFDVREASVRLE